MISCFENDCKVFREFLGKKANGFEGLDKKDLAKPGSACYNTKVN